MTESVQALIGAAGIGGRRVRTVVRLLTEGPHTLDTLVAASAVERRTVEAVLRAVGPDLVTTGEQVRITPARTAVYRDLIGYERLLATEPADPLELRLAAAAELVATVQTWIDQAPRPRQALDHVAATARTVVRRALWLDATFDLDAAAVVCLGDHDLTSLALAAVNPHVSITVVDIDDRILEFLDERGRARCLYADLRHGLPAGVTEWADLVFTDPPYTPDGVSLFLRRGLGTLRDRDTGRLLLAYGYADGHPALGLKVQQAIGALHLVAEAILPDFHRYHGAQAVGASSDLYQLRPTARSRRAIDGGSGATNIYTHGAQSLEADSTPLVSELAVPLCTAAAGPADLPLAARIGDHWPPAPPRADDAAAVEEAPASMGSAPASMGSAQASMGSAPASIALAQALTGGLPTNVARSGVAVAADLSADPGSWLLRLLLTVDVARLAVLVPNNHPDLSSAAGQGDLRTLVGAKYRLTLRRSTPDARHAIVEAERIDAADLDPAERAVRFVLDRPFGKPANTWREALIRASGGQLTKNEARARIDPAGLDERLIDLPRHRLRHLAGAIPASLSTVDTNAAGP